MTAQTHIKLQVNHSVDETATTLGMVDTTKEYEVNIQVAAGWAVIGHYRDSTLQTVTLKKSNELEVN